MKTLILVCCFAFSSLAFGYQAIFEMFVTGGKDACSFGDSILVSIPRNNQEPLIVKGRVVVSFPILGCSQFYDSNICDYQDEEHGRVTVYHSDARASSLVEGIIFELKNGVFCEYIPKRMQGT